MRLILMGTALIVALSGCSLAKTTSVITNQAAFVEDDVFSNADTCAVDNSHDSEHTQYADIAIPDKEMNVDTQFELIEYTEAGPSTPINLSEENSRTLEELFSFEDGHAMEGPTESPCIYELHINDKYYFLLPDFDFIEARIGDTYWRKNLSAGERETLSKIILEYI